jgi:tetratricopeptide (TPR) repeat protein
LFLLLSLVLLAVYFPALQGAMLWDDAGHVTRPELQSVSGLLRIWFELGATQQYYPLLHSAFWLQHRLWGDATLGYHVVNVLAHAAAACLFAAVLRRLAVRGATLAACIFALHPVGVESVAWIAEQKNTLSTVFYLAAALAWLRFEADRRPTRYLVASAWFVAALLTKTVTATLPAALLVLAWWRRGRLSWSDDVRPLLPWLGVGVAAGLGTAWLETHQIGAQGSDFALGPVERVLLAGRVVWFYVGKLLWPADLAFFYPRWTIDAGAAWQWLFPLAVLVALALAAWWSRRDRGPLAALLLFGGTLFPVLGFVNVYPFVFSYVADHFQYLACLGLIALLAAGATHAATRCRLPAWCGPTGAAGLLLLLAGLGWRQSGNYRDVFTLYRATLERSPDSWVAHLNLGAALDEAGQPTEALPHLQRALELKRDHPETLNSLGNVLNRLGRPADARPLLERAVQLQPRFASAHNTLGVSRMAVGDADGGLAAFRRAVELDARFATARTNLGWALANRGRPAEALVHLEQARRLQPDHADAVLKTGLVLAMSGRMADALPHFRRAVDLQPDNPEAHLMLGTTLLELSRPDEALRPFEAALALAPTHRGARLGLEQARRMLGR